jgi:hypothetical protein
VRDASAARSDRYEDYTSSSEDNYLRMKIQNRNRWNAIDDFDYWYNPNYSLNNYYYGRYSFNPYIGINPFLMNNWYSPFFGSYYNSYNMGWFGSYYPQMGFGYGYAPVYVIKTPTKINRVNRPNLAGYNNRNYNNRNINNNVNKQTLGSSVRRAFTPNNNNNTYNNNNTNRTYNNTNDRPVRSYTPSSSSGGGSSRGSSSGGGGISRPPRN